MAAESNIRLSYLVYQQLKCEKLLVVMLFVPLLTCDHYSGKFVMEAEALIIVCQKNPKR